MGCIVWAPCLTQADGPASVVVTPAPSVADPRERRAGGNGDSVGPGGGRVIGAPDGDIVIISLDVELCGGQRAARRDADGAPLVVAVVAWAVGGAAA